MICQYAMNSNNELVFVDHVANGKNCGCFCPNCKEQMVAKNSGEYRTHHFAHFSGIDCGGYRESLLHIWSKQILKESKMIGLPAYKTLARSQLYLAASGQEVVFSLPQRKIYFRSVEIEKWDSVSNLVPDIVGVTKNGTTFWIEIFVSHKIPPHKLSIIKDNNINCIEVKIPDAIEDKSQLEEFLLSSYDEEYKHFLNYPYGDALIRNKKLSYFNKLKSTCKTVKLENCVSCFFNFYLANQYDELFRDYSDDLKHALSFFHNDKDFIKSQLELLIDHNSLSSLSKLVANNKRFFDILSTVLLQDRYCDDLDLIHVPDKTYERLLQFMDEANKIHELYSRKLLCQDSYLHLRQFVPCKFYHAVSKKNDTSFVFCKHH